MKANIKRFDRTMPLPEYKTKGAAAFDLAARETVVIQKGAIGYVPLNVAIKPPKGYFLLIAARSSTHKKGLIMANGVCIGDPDFSGDGDEYLAIYYNFTKAPVRVEKGDRIAQGMFIRFAKASWRDVRTMRGKTRGGIGSTGVR